MSPDSLKILRTIAVEESDVPIAKISEVELDIENPNLKSIKAIIDVMII